MVQHRRRRAEWKPERSFTVREANALIPSLERIFARIDLELMSIRREADRLQILELLWGDDIGSPDNPDAAEASGHRLEISTRIETIESLVETEIESKGMRLPPGGLENGLVDFPTTWEGRWVFLCWHRGEPRMRAWHELKDGFAGRNELTTEQLWRMGSGNAGEASSLD
jgi:hypothetical protein